MVLQKNSKMLDSTINVGILSRRGEVETTRPVPLVIERT